MDAATAKGWWGSPILLPATGAGAQFILQHMQKRFGPGDGERHVPSSLALVLTYGGTTPHQGNQPKVLDGGGVIVLGVRTTKVFPPDPNARTVPVRGHVATYGDATSGSTGNTYRYVRWAIRDGEHFVEWRVLDDPKRRTLDELVHILDALGEA